MEQRPRVGVLIAIILLSGQEFAAANTVVLMMSTQGGAVAAPIVREVLARFFELKAARDNTYAQNRSTSDRTL